MTRSHYNGGGTGSPRTVVPNGEVIKRERQNRGWSREELSFRSQIKVEQLAKQEQDSKNRGRFYHRNKSRSRRHETPGVGKSALGRMESGRPVLVLSLVIVAKTLEVPVELLIA